jgi:hypothetical protein
MMPSLAPSPRLEAVPLLRDVRIQTVSGYRQFLDLEPAWNRLVESARGDRAHPFLEYQWARTWWDCFGADNSLHILTVHLGDEIVAIAPLMRSRVRMLGVTLRRLGFLYNDHVPRADFVMGKYPELAYNAIWRHLSEHRDWDLLQLCQLPDTSPTLNFLSRLADADGFGTGTWDAGASPYIMTSGSWTDYFGSIPGKHRSNLRNRLKRIGQFGETSRETVTAGELDGALEDGFRIEGSAWKGEAGTGIACAPELRRFYSEFARRASERGWLRLNFLRAGDKRVAFDYSLVYGNRVFLLKLGYESEFSAYAPSQLLLSMVLQRAFEEGSEEYDFLGEFVDWKRSWAQQSTDHRWLYITAPGISGRLFHFLKFHAAPAAKRLLRRG